MGSSSDVPDAKKESFELAVITERRIVVPIESSPPKFFDFKAADFIDPSIGFHALERTDTMLGFRWSGAAPAVKLRERIDRSSPVSIHAVIMSFAPGISASDLRLLIDHEVATVRAVEEFGMVSLYAEAMPSAQHNITLQFSSPFFQEDSQPSRKLGFALVSIRVASAE